MGASRGPSFSRHLHAFCSPPHHGHPNQLVCNYVKTEIASRPTGQLKGCLRICAFPSEQNLFSIGLSERGASRSPKHQNGLALLSLPVFLLPFQLGQVNHLQVQVWMKGCPGPPRGNNKPKHTPICCLCSSRLWSSQTSRVFLGRSRKSRLLGRAVCRRRIWWWTAGTLRTR